MSFEQQRRQQFLSESHYKETLKDFPKSIALFEASPAGSGDTIEEGWMISHRVIAFILFDKIQLRYTAGVEISLLRQELEDVVTAYEKYAADLWAMHNRNEQVFQLFSIDDYCQLMQLCGLCFLLHRRDLLPRIAALQDGEGGANGGADTLYEEFMAYGVGPESRYETNHIFQKRPYENIFYALTETTPELALKELHLFLKRWYKDLAGTAWHDSHKPDEEGNTNGYVGYWSFEAGAAVILMGIEDDFSLHQYLYYPKDMVAWCRENMHLSDPTNTHDLALRVLAGEDCLRSGYWFTPARAGSRQRFEQGQVMPDVGNPAFETIWQWDADQD